QTRRPVLLQQRRDPCQRGTCACQPLAAGHGQQHVRKACGDDLRGELWVPCLRWKSERGEGALGVDPCPDPSRPPEQPRAGARGGFCSNQRRSCSGASWRKSGVSSSTSCSSSDSGGCAGPGSGSRGNGSGGAGGTGAGSGGSGSASSNGDSICCVCSSRPCSG